MILSATQIQQLLHGNTEWQRWVAPLQDLLPRYEIDRPDRIAMFISQCGHESLNFRVLEENLNYSADGLNKIFPKYFRRANRNAAPFHRQPEKIANVVYCDRMGNGDEKSGDGYKFRGRGVIQLTGKSNVSAFGASVGLDVDQAIAHLSGKLGALESACWFWQTNNINKYADKQDVRAATKKINGGDNGLADRQHHYGRALAVLNGSYTPKPAPILLKIGSSGNEVIKVQTKLGLEADGIYGRVTAAAVKKWQRKNKLIADGIVGPKTYAIIIG